MLLHRQHSFTASSNHSHVVSRYECSQPQGILSRLLLAPDIVGPGLGGVAHGFGRVADLWPRQLLFTCMDECPVLGNEV
jgi:hypothetical protein